MGRGTLPDGGRSATRFAVSVILTGVGVTALYAAAVVGIHRWNVRRLRKQGNLDVLLRVDWDALLQGLVPPAASPELASDVPATLPTGDPTPLSLRRSVANEHAPRRALLLSLVAGDPGEN